jgi:hypothetical protein
MPLSAPTISSVQQKSQFLQINFTNSGSGDHNQLWRHEPTEYGGVFIKIADPISWSTSSAQFRDYNVANGRNYTYYMVAVDGSGNIAVSATIGGPFTLPGGLLHSVRKNNQTSATIAQNAGSIVSLNDTPPQPRAYNRETASRPVGNAALPVVSVGLIKKTQVNPPMISIFGASDIRSTLRAIYTSPYYACLRDGMGNKWFGRLLPFEERYGAVYADIGVVFEVLDFNEAVA